LTSIPGGSAIAVGPVVNTAMCSVLFKNTSVLILGKRWNY
jgi:hypothetical protein